jgi:hypothetical protein
LLQYKSATQEKHHSSNAAWSITNLIFKILDLLLTDFKF